MVFNLGVLFLQCSRTHRLPGSPLGLLLFPGSLGGKNTAKAENTTDPAQGRPHPTPSPISPLSSMIGPVETLARITNASLAQ
jgi:hypothetical protein